MDNFYDYDYKDDGTAAGGSQKTKGPVPILAIVFIIIVLIAIALIVWKPDFFTDVVNSHGIYLSRPQAENILRGSLASYTSYDIFSAPNQSFFGITPPNIQTFVGEGISSTEIKDGWTTLAALQNGTNYTVMSYTVIELNLSSASMKPNSTGKLISHPKEGNMNGVNYTYGTVTNSSYAAMGNQNEILFLGKKNSYMEIALIANTNGTAPSINDTVLVTDITSEIPSPSPPSNQISNSTNGSS